MQENAKTANDRADPLDDAALISLFNHRDERALWECERRYRSFLLSVAQEILRDRRDSEECLNDTLLRAWNAIPPAQPRSLRAYLTKIIRHLAIDRIRRQESAGRVARSALVALEELENFLPDREQEGLAAQESLRRILNDFLASCSPRQRYIFMSRYYMTRSSAQIAQLLCVSTSTVRKELAKMKQKLRMMLHKEGFYYGEEYGQSDE